MLNIKFKISKWTFTAPDNILSVLRQCYCDIIPGTVISYLTVHGQTLEGQTLEWTNPRVDKP